MVSSMHWPTGPCKPTHLTKSLATASDARSSPAPSPSVDAHAESSSISVVVFGAAEEAELPKPIARLHGTDVDITINSFASANKTFISTRARPNNL
jgi:hypothetical protein